MEVFKFIHHILAALFVGLTVADVLFLRGPLSNVVAPEALMASWRKKAALWQMALFFTVIGLGLFLWVPRIEIFSPIIYHSKAMLAVIYLILAKARMFIERKRGAQITLTRVMSAIVFFIFALGAFGGL